MWVIFRFYAVELSSSNMHKKANLWKKNEMPSWSQNCPRVWCDWRPTPWYEHRFTFRYLAANAKSRSLENLRSNDSLVFSWHGLWLRGKGWHAALIAKSLTHYSFCPFLRDHQRLWATQDCCRSFCDWPEGARHKAQASPSIHCNAAMSFVLSPCKPSL